MDLRTEETEADKILQRAIALLDRLPERDVSASTARVYKATMKRMWVEWKYRDALAVHMLTPVRPAEFVPSLREGRHVPGIAVRLEARVLIVNVAPVKSHNGKYGTRESVMRFHATSGHPAVVHLVALCRSGGGRVTISLDDTNGMRKSFAKLGRKALGPAIVITPYVFPQSGDRRPQEDGWSRRRRSGRRRPLHRPHAIALWPR